MSASSWMQFFEMPKVVGIDFFQWKEKNIFLDLFSLEECWVLSDCSFHLRDTVVARVILMPSLEQVGESAQKHCGSSNPLVQSLAFVLCCSVIIFGLPHPPHRDCLLTFIRYFFLYILFSAAIWLSHFCFMNFLVFCWLIDLIYICFIRLVNWQVGFAYW